MKQKVHIPAPAFALRIVTTLILIFLCTFAHSAQQAAAPPPAALPPAHDAAPDKPPTWEEASASLINVLTARGHNYVFIWNAKEQYRASLEKNFDSPMRCDFSGEAFAFESLHGTAKAGVFTLDFTRVDPFSIQVGYDQSLGVWATTMAGLHGMAISSWKGVVRSHVVVADVKGTVKPSLLEPGCALGEKHCKPDEGTTTSADQFFDDQRSAQAFADAAKRAAIACATDPNSAAN